MDPFFVKELNHQGYIIGEIFNLLYTKCINFKKKTILLV